MSGLNEKTTEQTQAITDKSDEIIAAIDALTTATGSGVTNAATIVDAIEAMQADIVIGNASLSAIDANTALSAEHTADMVTALGTINTNITTTRTAIVEVLSNMDNNIAQMKVLLADFIAPLIESTALAVNALEFYARANSCLCENVAPALGPPLSVDPVAIDDTHCKRVQYLFDHWSDGISSVVNGIQAGAAFTSAGAGILLATGVIPGVDLVTVPAGVIAGLIGIMAVGLGFRIGKVLEFFVTYDTELKNLLFAASSADIAKETFDTFVDSQVSWLTDADVAIALKLMGWGGIWNALYDQTIVWDLTGYSGSICVPAGCVTVDSVPYTSASSGGSGSGHGVAVNLAGMTRLSVVGSTSGDVTFTPAIIYGGDIFGWTITVLSGDANVTWRVGAPATTGVFTTTIDYGTGNTPHVMENHTGTFFIRNGASGAAFEIEICPPA